MTNNRSGAQIFFVALAACLIAAACSTGTATQAAVSTPTPSATAKATPTASPTASPTVEITLDPSAFESASASDSAAPSEVPSASSSAIPSASPTSAAAACTGSADNQAFFANTAGLMKFDVYCASLPAKWYLTAGGYTQPKGGTVTITYQKTGGGQLDISEGAFCTGTCNTHVSTLGSASFGSLSGEFDLLSASPDVYVIYVNPGTATAYSIKGTGVTQADFKNLAAAMVKVPKP